MAFINEIADGIIVDEGIDIPSFYDRIQVKLDLRFWLQILFYGLLTWKTGQNQENRQNTAATNQHKDMKILIPGRK